MSESPTLFDLLTSCLSYRQRAREAHACALIESRNSVQGCYSMRANQQEALAHMLEEVADSVSGRIERMLISET